MRNKSLHRRHFLETVAGVVSSGLAQGAEAERGLVGHWRLRGDPRDSSGLENHGTNHGADLSAPGPAGAANPAARFNGRDSYIEVPHSPSLRLGASDFSIAVWVNLNTDLDVPGDILSKYDPLARTGFNFNIKTNFVTTSPSNHRNVQFGIDHGRVDASWTDCGRAGNAVHVFALTVYNGQLYAGTCEAGEREAGHVYRYAGGTIWIDCGAPDKSNAISPLAVFEGKLYAGSARYILGGSSLPASPNEAPGGTVYRYEGGKRWVDCGKLGDIPAVYGLAVYRGRLYGSSRYAPAGVFRYEGGRAWTSCGTPEGKRVTSLAVYNGSLYGLSLDGGFVFRYEGGTNWSVVGKLPDTTQTYGFATYTGKLYVSTWPTGSVFRYDGDDQWTHCGRLGKELEVMGMAVYNGKLYAGTLPLAEVYRYEGGREWARTGQLDQTPNVRYRRAWSMAVFQGKLFAGTLPSGHIYSFEAGKSVTHDHELGAGWRHLAAVRNGRRLRLFVDGKQVASSTSFDPADYDVSNDQPLRIGLGDHDYFSGRLSDLRLYNRALSEAEVAALFRKH